ncbi:hypothetical protein [Priestia filamentosa]|uniref:hypothetical protein n=1 Tax=Priestia filamentosa TaxID=1402861 RepID=UPI002894D31A|nr:hypothetical protein [Priestia filamentosa]MDT3766445.1 hypothetical protein [Priestia filamentosa]
MSFENGKGKEMGKYGYGKRHNNQNKKDEKEARVLEAPVRIDVEGIEDPLFDELQGLIGESILIVTESDQLQLFGQAFRPIFCGTILAVEQGNLTLFPVNIKMVTAPFFQFPTPLSIPLEKIAQFTPNFDCNARIPLT